MSAPGLYPQFVFVDLVRSEPVPNDFSWRSRNDGICGHVPRHHAARGYHCPPTNTYGCQNDGTEANPVVPLKGRSAAQVRCAAVTNPPSVTNGTAKLAHVMVASTDDPHVIRDHAARPDVSIDLDGASLPNIDVVSQAEAIRRPESGPGADMHRFPHADILTNRVDSVDALEDRLQQRNHEIEFKAPCTPRRKFCTIASFVYCSEAVLHPSLR